MISQNFRNYLITNVFKGNWSEIRNQFGVVLFWNSSNIGFTPSLRHDKIRENIKLSEDDHESHSKKKSGKTPHVGHQDQGFYHKGEKEEFDKSHS